jgi:hypothetical protein
MSMFMTADDGTGKALNPSDDFLRDVVMNLCVTRFIIIIARASCAMFLSAPRGVSLFLV